MTTKIELLECYEYLPEKFKRLCNNKTKGEIFKAIFSLCDTLQSGIRTDGYGNECGITLKEHLEYSRSLIQISYIINHKKKNDAKHF